MRKRYVHIVFILAILGLSLFLNINNWENINNTISADNTVSDAEDSSVSTRGAKYISTDLSSLGYIYDGRHAVFSYGDCAVVVGYYDPTARYYLYYILLYNQQVLLSVDIGYTYYPNSLDTANYDYDPDDEVAVFNTHMLSIYDDNGTELGNVNISGSEIKSCDINRDGVSEVVVIDYDGLYIIDTLSFTVIDTINISYPLVDVAFGDVDCDSYNDIIILYQTFSSTYVAVYSGTNYSIIENISLLIDNPISVYSIDVNFDGAYDIIVDGEIFSQDKFVLIGGGLNMSICDELIISTGDVDFGVFTMNNYYYSPENDRYELIFPYSEEDICYLYRIAIDYRGMYFIGEKVSEIEHPNFLMIADGFTNFSTPPAFITAEQKIYVHSIQPIHQVMVSNYPYYCPIYAFMYDYDVDGRDDLCLISSQDLRVYISDSSSPTILSVNVNPTNATTEDVITVDVVASDNSTIISAFVHIYEVGSPFYEEWIMFKKEVIGNVYVWEAFVAGLVYGDYRINVAVTDSFGNKASLDSSDVVPLKVHGVVYEGVRIATNISCYYDYFDVVDIDGDNIDEAIVILYVDNYLNVTILEFDQYWHASYTYIYMFYNSSRFLFKKWDINNDGYLDFVGLLENGTRLDIIYIYGSNTTPQIYPYTVNGVANITSMDFVRRDSGTYDVIIGTENGVYFPNGTRIIGDVYASYIFGLDRDEVSNGEIAVIIGNYTGVYIMIYNVTSNTQEYFGTILENVSIYEEYTSEPPGEVLYDRFVSSDYELLITAYGFYGEKQLIVYDPDTRFILYHKSLTDAMIRGVFDFDCNGLVDVAICDIDYNVVIYNGSLEKLFEQGIGEPFGSVYMFDWDSDGEVELTTVVERESASALIVIDIAENAIRGSMIKGFVANYKPLILVSESMYVGMLGIFYYMAANMSYVDLFYMIDISNYYFPNITVDISSNFLMQDQSMDITLSARDFFGTPINDAQCLLNVTSELGTYTYMLLNTGGGNYSLNIPVNSWGIGIVNISITFIHSRYVWSQYTYTVIVFGRLRPMISYSYIVYQGDQLSIIIDVLDENLNPVYGGEVYLIFGGETMVAENVGNNTYKVELNTSKLPIGEYFAHLEIFHPYAEPKTETINILVTGEVDIQIFGKAIDPDQAVVQGEDIPLRIDLFDEYGNPLKDASVSALFFGKFYGFYSHSNGTYTTIISTESIQAGEHKCYISISHPIVGLIEKNISLYILGYPMVGVDLGESAMIQDTYRQIGIIVEDKYGYPASNLNITVVLANKAYAARESGDEIGVYYANISLYNLYHGFYDLNVIVEGENYVSKTYTTKIYVDVKIPELEITFRDLVILLIISFAISIIGLLIYHKILSIVKKKKQEAVKQSVKVMNKLYVSVLLILMVSMFYSYIQYGEGHYGNALIGIAMGLLLTILLSALWIYRDINKNIFLEKFHKGGMILSLWHLLLVPVLLYMIFYIGRHIEWFYVHIVEDIIAIGGYTIPKLLLSLLGTYIGSFAVITINIYRESNKIVNKIQYMRQHETAEAVISKEKEYNITKLTDSIRTKFLVFLVIIGATIVTTTKLLQYYAIGLIVVIPLLVIFVIPYFSAKTLQLLTGGRETII